MKKLNEFSTGALVTSFLFFVSIGFAQITYAEDVSYAVNPKPTDKQLDTSVSYYDLKLEPSEKTSVTVSVVNNADKPITINTNVDKAATNSNGLVEYNNSKNLENINLIYDISKLITISEPTFEIPAKGRKDVTYIIEAPSKNFDGVLVGGLNFIEKEEQDKEEKNQKKTGMAIKNRYAYSVAVVLHGEKKLTDNDVSTGKIKIEQLNGRNNIYYPIQNKSARFLNKTNVTAKVYEKDLNSEKPIYIEEKKDAQVAPNSIYKFKIGTNEKKLKAGKYTVAMEVSSKEQSWIFSQDFEITSEKAKKLNETAVIKEEDYSLYIYLGIGIAILILIPMIVLIIYVRRKNKQIEELKRENDGK